MRRRLSPILSPVPTVALMNIQATLLTSLMFLQSAAGAACHGVERVHIQLINDAGASAHLLTNAASEAAWLLDSLCVQVSWSAEARNGELEIHIVAAPLALQAKTSCLGVAMLTFATGTRGTVFLSRVQQVVASHPDLIDAKTLLAHVLAHEIGHLLLHTTTHSGRGIMQANFGELQLRMASQRRLVFTESDRRTVLRKRDVAEAQRSTSR